MSEINANFVVSPIQTTIAVTDNNIEFTPTDVQLSIFAGGYAGAAGTSGQLQYNNGGVLAGVPTTSWNGTKLSLGAASNVIISGGSANYYLKTDGAGNLSWSVLGNVAYANSAGNANIAYSLTSNVANVIITGGTNGYVLQTDGTGNLSWTAQTGGSPGNGSPGGSNTQIQYNDSGSFGGNAGFTFNEVTGDVNLPANLVVVGNITGTVSTAGTAGTVTTNAQPNITSVGTLTSLAVTGNISGNNYTGGLYSLPYGFENVTLVGAPIGTYNFYILSNAIHYTSSALSNVVINFAGNSTVSLNSLMNVGHSVTSTYVMPTGSTAYTVSSITIDGSSQSIKWVNGATPVAVPNVTSAFTFTIVKTSSTPTYTVLGSVTRYV